MRVAKRIGIVLLALVALWLVIAAVQPTKYNYEQSVDIKAPKEVVFAKFNNLKTMETWSPWQDMDTTIQTTYSEQVEGVGASQSWTSKNSGDGKMTITESTVPTSLKYALEFDGHGGNDAYVNLADGDGGATKTTWGMNMNMPFPWNAMMLFMGGSMEKDMNEMYDLGLSKLKALSEAEASSTPPAPSYSVQVQDYPGKTFLAIRDKVKISSGMQEFYTKSVGALKGEVQGKKAEMDGMAHGIYYSWDMAGDMTDMAAAIPVKNADKLKVSGKNIQVASVPAGKGLLIDYRGGYSGIGSAHEAMEAYLGDKKLKQKFPVLEEYVAGPDSEPDSSKWLTKIWYFYE